MCDVASFSVSSDRPLLGFSEVHSFRHQAPALPGMVASAGTKVSASESHDVPESPITSLIFVAGLIMLLRRGIEMMLNGKDEAICQAPVLSLFRPPTCKPLS
jgi:hypothetical protein